MVSVVVAVHKLLSITETVYTPAAKFELITLVLPLGNQLYVYVEGVPPTTAKVAEPVLSLKQLTLVVPITDNVMADVWFTKIELVCAQLLASVTVTVYVMLPAKFVAEDELPPDGIHI